MEFGFGAKWVELLKEIAPRVTWVLHRDLIIALAARHRLPAVYIEHFFVTAGGLISYGPDFVNQFRRAAGYVDRILKGEKPADLLALSVTLWG